MDWNKLLQVILKKPFWFGLGFIGYIFLNGVLNKTYVTVPRIFVNFPIWFALIFIFVNFLVVPLLVSLTINLSIDKIKDFKKINGGQGLISSLGIFFSLIGGACPSCFIGLFPAFVGLFGSTLTLSSLPLYGFEIQLFSSLILIISLHYLTRRNVCKIN